MTPDIIEFLEESNAIEGVYSPKSLDDAVEAWKFLIGCNMMTLKNIKLTHEILMKNQPLRFSDIGHFRRQSVFVNYQRMMAPELIENKLLMEFCLPTMKESPAPDWKALHIRYEEIHPFIDGNGRTGRMFMNWTRMKRCGLPVLVIKELEKQEYYEWFTKRS